MRVFCAAVSVVPSGMFPELMREVMEVRLERTLVAVAKSPEW